MNNAPDLATKPRVSKLTLSAVLLAVIGLAVWGMVSAGKAPEVVQPGTPLVTQGNDSPAAQDQEPALALERVIHDPKSTDEQRREAYEAKGDAAEARGEFDTAFDAYYSAETLVDPEKEVDLWVRLELKASRMLRNMGDLRAAHELLQKVVLVAWEIGSPNLEGLSDELSGLSDQLDLPGRKDDMLPFYRRAFSVRESVLGPNHPDLADHLQNFARHLRLLDQWEEAVPYLRRSLEITQATNGYGWKILSGVEQLRDALIHVNKIDEAVPYGRQALALKEKKVGENNPGLADDLVEYGKLLQKSTSSREEAEQVFQRAMEMQLNHSAVDHRYQRLALYELAKIYQEINRLPEAEALCRKAFEVPDILDGKFDIGKANSLTGLSQILEGSGRLSQAEPFLRNAARIQFRAGADPFAGVANPSEAAANYLRVARLLEIPDEEIHRRLDEERGTDGVTKKEFDKLWQEVLAKNPKDAVNEQPTPPK